MKRFRNIYNFASSMAVLLTAVLAGCTDEMEYPGDDGAGRPVTLSVNVSLPDMTPISRSDMAAGLDGRVESLWVGVYNATSGKRTGYTELKGLSASPTHGAMQVVDIEALTGRSYIVAVANYEGRNANDGSGTVDFAKALDAADTWEKFNNISTMFDPDGDIHTDVPLNALLMSGHYMAGTHANGEHTLIEAVPIPADGKMPGAIHLRRTISQVRFNVTYNEANIEELEVLGWAVHNVPNQSWVYEHTSGVLNAGDVRTVGSNGSYQHTATTNIVERNQNTFTFDWWQVENKRTGLEPSEAHNKNGDYYSYREEEFKTAEGSLNTGKYKSLVTAVDADDLSNNNATYVELHVRMNMTVDENGNKLPGARVVNGVYTVHLGYCEGAGKDKARDFNCRRNSKYTYNVTINNVNDILVEARKEGEPTPGAEGMVSDVTHKYVELDAHYGVYNIELTQEDLYPKEVNPESDRSFDYMIRCYDEHNQRVDIDSRDLATVPAENSRSRKYLDWVEIRRTTDATTLAEYKPRSGTYADSSNPTMTLHEFWERVKNRTIDPGYFTLFFNEYVYETAADGNEAGSVAWHDYVNKSNRTVWIRVLVDQSTDGESTYFNSKYAFSQRSIQTYYNTKPGTATALGVEHVNESYGLNLRSIFREGDNDNNGRYNTAMYAAGGKSGWKYTDWKNGIYLWRSYVDTEKPQTINAINTQSVMQPAYDESNPRAVPALVQLPSEHTKYDPDLSDNAKTIEAINACMNRNRDLNGDGYIDAGELRWYVPTANQYAHIILGRRSLVTPIMDYTRLTRLPYFEGDRVEISPNNVAENNGLVTSLLIYGSNNKNNIVWAMEGLSTSSNRTYAMDPWNVRCVRDLGTNMSEVTDGESVKAAYTRRSENVIELTYYDEQSIRQEKITHMYPHHIANQDYNRCYKAFEFSDLLQVSMLNGYNDYGMNAWGRWLTEKNPCQATNDNSDQLGKYLEGDGWRVPNQKEIAIMTSLKINPTRSSFGLSATFSFYDLQGYAFGMNPDIMGNLDYTNRYVMVPRFDYALNQQPVWELSSAYIRCVRDVD